jgi:flagellar basal-body rod protein FlgC
MGMGPFSTIDVSTTGITFSRFWLDVLAHNMANVNTVRPFDEEPFRAKFLRAEETVGAEFREPGRGVHLEEIVAAQGDPAVVYDPDNPLANEQGLVKRAMVDMAGQMSDLIVAQRAYQMNIRVVQAAKEAYEAALRVGR